MLIYSTITALTADHAELHMLACRDWRTNGSLSGATACGEPVVATSTDRGVAVALAGGQPFLCDEVSPLETPRPRCPRCAVVKAMLHEDHVRNEVTGWDVR